MLVHRTFCNMMKPIFTLMNFSPLETLKKSLCNRHPFSPTAFMVLQQEKTP